MKTIEIDALPSDFPEEYTFRDLNEWYVRTGEPRYIGMTLKQEMWYRNLLTPEFITQRVVTYRGVPIIVTDQD